MGPGASSMVVKNLGMLRIPHTVKIHDFIEILYRVNAATLTASVNIFNVDFLTLKITVLSSKWPEVSWSSIVKLVISVSLTPRTVHCKPSVVGKLPWVTSKVGGFGGSTRK